MIFVEPAAGSVNRPTFLASSVFDSPGTITASTGIAADALNGVTYDAWKPTSVAFVGNISIALSAAQAADTLCVAAHNLGTINARVSLEYDNGAGFVRLASFFPDDDRAIMLIGPVITSANWRFRIEGFPTAQPVVGVVMIGKRLTLPTGLTGDYVPTNWGRRVEILGGETLSGQFINQRIIRQSGETRITPGLIDRDWWTTNGDPLRARYDEGKPFFYAGGPSLFQHDVAYCWRPERAQEMRPAYSSANYVAFGMDVNFYA